MTKPLGVNTATGKEDLQSVILYIIIPFKVSLQERIFLFLLIIQENDFKEPNLAAPQL